MAPLHVAPLSGEALRPLRGCAELDRGQQCPEELSVVIPEAAGLWGAWCQETCQVPGGGGARWELSVESSEGKSSESGIHAGE